jgi:hypothetical protein
MEKSQVIYGHVVNIGGSGNIGQVGDHIEYHWHAGDIPEDMQSLAVCLYAETATMSFVDMMRLLDVRSSPLAFRHNQERYEEFVGIAKDHLEELDNLIKRYSTSLPTAVMTNENLIERQLRWAFTRLRTKPAQAILELDVFTKMQKISEYINSFCLRSGHKRYQTEWNLVASEMTEIATAAQQPHAMIGVDDFIRVRFGTQQTVLEKYKDLRSVGDDSVYELSFLYFAIDYHMLLFAKP